MNETERIVTNSPSFEYVYVANQRCACGGTFATVRQELTLTPEGPLDRITARCTACGAERVFDFDIGSFFGQFERYAHFFDVDRRFKEAMEQVRAGALPDAEALLASVVDAAEGEPLFAWAHFHLGRVVLEQGRAEEAIAHLARAAAIQPLEADIHAALAHACQMAGREAEALQHAQESETLRARFEGQD
ncbi:MAG: hypothetical protein JXD18_12675 [Anaerolineae bacterium]|nr:hypothetical protein [Anaerolineae bacterium]